MAAAIVLAAIFALSFTRGCTCAGQHVFPDQETHGNRQDKVCKDVLNKGHFI
jgi:hypothetical protein